MDRKAAKELLHINGWLDRVDEIVKRGEQLQRALPFEVLLVDVE